jgi:hypothetical protein
MDHSEVVLGRIKLRWPSDLPQPKVFFGVPVQPHDWAFTLDDEQHTLAKAALEEVRRPILENLEFEIS